eukprot:1159418-Pelagomonas_calceolata.AAC.1
MRAAYDKMFADFGQSGLDMAAIESMRPWYHGLDVPGLMPWPKLYPQAHRLVFLALFLTKTDEFQYSYELYCRVERTLLLRMAQIIVIAAKCAVCQSEWDWSAMISRYNGVDGRPSMQSMSATKPEVLYR